MITDPDALRARILFALDGMDIDATELARQIGRGADYVRDFLNGRKKSIKLEDLKKIENIMFLTDGFLTDERRWKGTDVEASLKRSLPTLIDTMDVSGSFVTKDPARGTIKIFAPQFPGERGEMIVRPDPMDIVPKPWFLKQARGAYGIFIIDDTMSPAFEAGDTAIINPHLPPMKGRDYLFRVDIGGNSFRAMIRRLLSWDDTTWDVAQFQPERTYRINRCDWPRLDRVAGKISV